MIVVLLILGAVAGALIASTEVKENKINILRNILLLIIIFGVSWAIIRWEL